MQIMPVHSNIIYRQHDYNKYDVPNVKYHRRNLRIARSCCYTQPSDK